jgi:hypothetical protein
MIQYLMEEEAYASHDDGEHLMTISCLLCLQAQLNASPQRGSSKFGRRKNKDSQRMEVHLMVEADYFHAMHVQIRDKVVHRQLQDDLVEICGCSKEPNLGLDS